MAAFCQIYNPAAFYWPWSADHLRVIAAIERSITEGLILAFAMPRGSGKTALCRMAVLWAASWGLCQYIYLIGANEQAGLRSLEAIKGWARSLHPYVDDFPEVSLAAEKLGKIAQRAAGQLQRGRSTDIVWETNRVVMPRIEAPANLPARDWRPDGMAASSQVVVAVSGLTGDGIRGSLFADPVTGELRRPDFILLDDPQTDESAKSPQQNADREELIAGAVLGMANPNRPAAVVMPCTVICRGDMVDRMLDRQRNPTWRGIRTALFKSMPTNKAAWDAYEEEYRQALGQDIPDRNRLNRYYRRHRKELDEGAEVSWSHRKAWEVSAVQHGMHLYFQKRSTFHAEYQNAPEDPQEAKAKLTAAMVLKKTNGRPRREVPQQAERVTGFIDVHDDVLYWSIGAWEPSFGAGYVIDYGTFPRQPEAYFQLESARHTLGRAFPGMGTEGAIYAGLDRQLGELLALRLPRDDGSDGQVDLILIDTGYKPDLVAKAIRALGQGGRVMPSRGWGIRAGSKPFHEFRPEAGAKIGHRWRTSVAPATRLRTLSIDTNWWKSAWRDALAAGGGERGAVTVFGDRAEEHRLWADHQVGEFPTETFGPWGRVEEWRQKPERPDVHWLDCGVGMFAAASYLGLSAPEWEAGRERRVRRASLSVLTKR